MPHKWCAWVGKSNEGVGGKPNTQPKKQPLDNEQKATHETNAYLPNVQQPLRWKEVFFQ